MNMVEAVIAPIELYSIQSDCESRCPISKTGFWDPVTHCAIKQFEGLSIPRTIDSWRKREKKKMGKIGFMGR